MTDLNGNTLCGSYRLSPVLSVLSEISEAPLHFKAPVDGILIVFQEYK